ncbi:MAG: thiamine pyrophosphate-dependent dehydrogenase E1 component subunit alpha [Burkholderiales bacterium]|nr:thiamine pyrophosphate-dependent dehydrogenase E1 component subunit alpha [Burkholderiales bacterium]
MPREVPDPLPMLRQMLLIREFDERIIGLRAGGDIYGAIHPYVGQEAVAVGVCAALTRADRVTSTHRGHGHCIAKGADIKRMMAELFGRIDGYCKGKGGSMHIADFSVGMLGANGIVAGGLPLAAGAALAAQLDGKRQVAVCFFGDGAVAEGEFHETLNISALWSLPLVFVCENNLYGGSSPIDVQHRTTDIAVRAAGYGMPAVSIDGNDAMAVFEAARAAVDRAREGDGPSLIECRTYRWHFHNMLRATIPAETRPSTELAAWRARDPIARLASALLSRRTLTEEGLTAMRMQVRGDVDEAIAFAQASPFPGREALLEDVFAASCCHPARACGTHDE